MVSVMNECEIDRNLSDASDHSFGMENHLDGTRANGRTGKSPMGDGSEKARALELDLEASFSENFRGDFSGSMESSSGGSDPSEIVRYSSSSSSREAATASWMHGFQLGDMIWGKVKSHPWWPGQIFNEAFASPSVRRAKREGHVLVAFFGDSSYGWFDLTELIPFDPHFPEKSRQTNSRIFVKAVEEAVDEVCRRGALAMACRCRNPFNFRQTGVPGYFSVDVVGYEPGGIYSSKQIQKARDDFVPAKALSFVHQLAVMPRRSESSKSVYWIRSMATLLAYRRAVFEEFDETYAQAFGVQPVRPSLNQSGMPDQADKFAPRAAPLSGRLVIAEPLGDKKSSVRSATKSASKTPSSSSSKKNKYVLKRRGEIPTTTSQPLPDFRPTVQSHRATTSDYYFDLAPGQQPQASVVISSLPAFRQAAAAAHTTSNSNIAAQRGDYVVQKRAPTEKPQLAPLPQPEDSRGRGHEDTKDPDRKDSVAGPVSKMAATDAHGILPMAQPAAKPHSVWEDFNDRLLKSEPPQQSQTEKPGRTVRLEGTEPTSIGLDLAKPTVKLDYPVAAIDTRNVFRLDEKPAADSKDNEGTNMSRAFVSPQNKLDIPSPSRDPTTGREAGFMPVDFQAKPGKAEEAAVKKNRVKRPTDDTGGTEQKKKKKKKKDEAANDRMVIPRDDEPRRKAAGKSIGVGFGSAELAQAELQRTNVEVVGGSGSFGPTISPAKLELESLDLQLPQLVTDLSTLAMDPFHGIERDAADIVRHVFLRFRSLVYQKSLSLSPPPNETDMPEVLATKPVADQLLLEPGTGPSNIASSKDLKDKREPTSSSKPSKPTSRPVDPSKVGRKRSPSDRQEEISAKRMKKLNKLKSLASEKKAGISQKSPEGRQQQQQQQRDQQDGMAVALTKPITAAEPAVKKQDPRPAPRIPEPTFLVMKFPPSSTLPSISSLKAKFGRFGALDLTATRVYWKSYTCKVLFKYKRDAQTAYNHGRNNDLFGQVRVHYNLRGLESAATEPEPLSGNGKQRLDSQAADGGPQFRPGNGNGGPASLLGHPLHRQQQRQSSVQLKSILKKPGDELGPSGGSIVKETPRVKFMLGGGDGRMEPPVAIASSNDGGIDALPSSEPISRFLPPPPPRPIQSHPRPSHPSISLPSTRLSDARRLPPSPPPVSRHLERFPVSLPPPPEHRILDSSGTRGHAQLKEGGRERSKVDISHQMLSLLMRCSDIVANVKSSLGYVPYHTL